MAPGATRVEEDAAAGGSPSFGRAAAPSADGGLALGADLLSSRGERQELILLPQLPHDLDVSLAKGGEPPRVFHSLRSDQHADRPQLQLQLGHRRIRAGGFGFVGVGELARSQRTRGVSHVHVQPAVRPNLLPAHGLNLRIRRVHAGGGVVPQRLERGLDRFALCLIRASLIQVFGIQVFKCSRSIVDDVDAEHHPGFGGVLGDRVHANLHGGVGTDIA